MIRLVGVAGTDLQLVLDDAVDDDDAVEDDDAALDIMEELDLVLDGTLLEETGIDDDLVEDTTEMEDGLVLEEVFALDVDDGTAEVVILTHLPFWQVFLDPQVCSQSPQFLSSVLMSTQSPSHSFSLEMVLNGPQV